MIKILLVEDDKGLREIYGVRLLAEGYDIVSAGDGNEALAVAIKERPKLVITDVMMPQIGGFEFLDILRSTTETRDIKVIMMTALSSQEQRERGERLGADRYLVKSQVGIEDVVRIVHEVLGDTPTEQDIDQTAAITAQPAASQPPSAGFSQPQPASPPSGAMPQPNVGAQPNMSTPGPAPVITPSVKPEPPKPAFMKNRIIQPLNDPNQSNIDLNELLDREIAKEAGLAENARPEIASTAQEQSIIDEQLAQFTANNNLASSDGSTRAPEDNIPEARISEDGTFTTDQPPQPLANTAITPPPPPPAPIAPAPRPVPPQPYTPQQPVQQPQPTPQPAPAPQQLAQQPTAAPSGITIPERQPVAPQPAATAPQFQAQATQPTPESPGIAIPQPVAATPAPAPVPPQQPPQPPTMPQPVQQPPQQSSLTQPPQS